MINNNPTTNFVMPYLLQGEIVEVLEKPIEEPTEHKIAIGYTVLAFFPNGTKTLLTNVIQSSLFGGGIGDYTQHRLQATKDASFKLPTDESSADQAMSAIGDQVLIAFIGGDVRRPIIVGFLPHPVRNFDIPDFDKTNTQSKTSYKGFETQTNIQGEVVYTYRGSPQVKDLILDASTELYERKDVGPVDLPEREQKSPLPSPALKHNKPPKIPKKATKELKTNDALVYPDEKYTTEQGFLELGEYYVVDSEGQTIFLDRDSKTLTISNGNDTIQIDKEHKKIFIESSGDMEITTAKDLVQSIKGNSHKTVDKNQMNEVKKDEFNTIGGKRSTNIIDSDKTDIGNDWTVSIGTAQPVEGGSGKIGKKHTATLSLATGNAITMNDDTIWMVHKTGAMLTLTKEGNAMLLAKDGSMISIDAAAGTVNLVSKKGVMFSVGEKIILASKSGKEFVSVKDGEVTIASGDTVNINAPMCAINSGNVVLGDKATMSAVNGENLVQWLSTHTHGTGVGPSSPAIISPSTFTNTPLDILSKSVKVRV